jgi:hypothetical protein
MNIVAVVIGMFLLYKCRKLINTKAWFAKLMIVGIIISAVDVYILQ